MVGIKTLLAGAADWDRERKKDKTGKPHPFWNYSIPLTEAEILRLAGAIPGSKTARAANVAFFQNTDELVELTAKDRLLFGGKTHVTRMEHALFGMRQLRDFLFSECDTQSSPGPNRGGKTFARIQKQTCISINRDPLRPDYRFPFDCSKGPLIQWSICPAKNTRQELLDLQRNIPDGYPFRMYMTKGDERIEFEPFEDRPHGVIHRVKSHQMPVDQFQREAVHVIGMDERGPDYIWDECRMRLLSTNGWMILAMALYDLELWLYEKNKRFDPDYRGLMTGPYGWYSWYQQDCPWVDQARSRQEAAEMGEDARAARCFGDPRLLSGTAFFKPEEMLKTLWRKLSTNPKWTMKFTGDAGAPAYEPWDKRPGWRLWQRPERGATYAIGADVALGKGGDNDYSTAHILRTDTAEIVGVFQDNTIESEDFGLQLLLAGRAFNTAVVGCEVNVEGASAHHWLKQHGYPRIYRSKGFSGRFNPMQDSLGWRTTGQSKAHALEALRLALKAAYEDKAGAVILYDSPTYLQLSDFGHLNQRRAKAHGTGGLSGHDDLTMSLAITLQVAEQAERPRRMTRADLERNEIEAWDREDLEEARRRREEDAAA